MRVLLRISTHRHQRLWAHPQERTRDAGGTTPVGGPCSGPGSGECRRALDRGLVADRPCAGASGSWGPVCTAIGGGGPAARATSTPMTRSTLTRGRVTPRCARRARRDGRRLPHPGGRLVPDAVRSRRTGPDGRRERPSLADPCRVGLRLRRRQSSLKRTHGGTRALSLLLRYGACARWHRRSDPSRAAAHRAVTIILVMHTQARRGAWSASSDSSMRAPTPVSPKRWTRRRRCIAMSCSGNSGRAS